MALSIRDLALRLSVSPSTVSEALRGSSLVKESTRIRIVAEAERLGYQCNPLASALMTDMRRSRNGCFRGNLALLDLDTAPRRSPALLAHQTALAEGAVQRAEELGFHTDHLSLQQGGITPASLADVLSARGISGVCILPACSPYPCSSLDWSSFSVLHADCIAGQPLFHAVSPDFQQALTLALDELAALGFSRPGLALETGLGPHQIRAWTIAFHAWFHSRFPAPAEPLITDDLNAATLGPWFEEEQPDVVLAHSLSVRDALHGLTTAPGRAPVFCSLQLTAKNPARPGLDLRPAALGRHAMDLLVDQVRRNERGIPALPYSSRVPAAWTPNLPAALPRAVLCA
ncbi:MAG: LacI family DNA-binding transcriptional regulator [Burkholderiales bacterium]|nr:LacI family DNA-binding transcriptional regulator [Opitutaceae bacterium]